MVGYSNCRLEKQSWLRKARALSSLENLTHKEAVMIAVEVATTGQSNGTKYEFRKIAPTDGDAYAQAVTEGFEEAGKITGL